MNYVIYQSDIEQAIRETDYANRYECGIGLLEWVVEQSIRTSAYYDCLKRENPTSNMLDAFKEMVRRSILWEYGKFNL